MRFPAAPGPRPLLGRSPKRSNPPPPEGRIAVLGAGKIGETLIRALIESDLVRPDRIVATARHADRLRALERNLGVTTSLSNPEAAGAAETVVISVHPQEVLEVLEEIRGVLDPRRMLISVAASVPIRTIEAAIGDGIPVIRGMPNTPCLLRSGMTAICAGRFAREEHLGRAERIFRSLGRCVRLDERHMDAVTGLSASGPAYIYLVIESLAEGGVKVGLPREISTQLAAQTVLGAARMVLETNDHPARLKDAVTTPAGCTIDGVLELEDGGVRVALIKAVVRATERARQLAAG